MTFKNRKKERIQKKVMDNLTYCRLEGDLLAVEASIRDNAPKEIRYEGSKIKIFIGKIINDINNAAKRYNTVCLSQDKEKAKAALDAFLKEHSEKELKLSGDAEELRKYIDKKLFKKDKGGLSRMSFALLFAINDRNNEYQCPEESLEVVSEILFNDPKTLGKLYALYKNNYMKISVGSSEIEKGFGLGMGFGGIIAASLLPLGVTGTIGLIDYLFGKKRANLAFSNMSTNETNATLALYLTLIEAAEVSDDKRKEMIDELLTRVSNMRSDAEYKRYVEKQNADESKQKIATCELALRRLGSIIGI